MIYRGIFPEAEEAAKKEVLAGLIERYYAKGFTKETIMDLLDLTDAQMDELS